MDEYTEPKIVDTPVSAIQKKPISEAKRKQLQDARDKKVLLKRKPAVESDSDSDEEHPKKKGKTITKTRDDDDEEHWSSTTNMIRTGALLTLAAGSYYFQNLYGAAIPKKKEPTVEAVPLPQTAQAPQTNSAVFQNPIRVLVGKSGFAL